MYQFFETILVENGKAKHLKYHQKRLDFTFKHHYFDKKTLKLEEILQDLPQNARCKVSYFHESYKVEFFPIRKREFKKFKVIDLDVEYSFKYTNRTTFDNIKKTYENFDDVIITSNNLLRDTTIANIALFIDDTWLTPKNDLLLGTTKMRLLERGFLKRQNLTIKELENCEKFAIMNAIIGFYEIKGYKLDLEF